MRARSALHTLLLFFANWIKDVLARPSTALISSCTARLDHQGHFSLGGRLSQPFFPPYCSLKVKAPLGYTAHISFSLPSSFSCHDDNLVMFMDGWQLVDKLRRSTQFYPAVRDSETSRRFVCTSKSVETTDNFGEIVYILPNYSNLLEIQVEFREQPTAGCWSMVGTEDMGRELQMSVGGVGTCSWLLPSSVHLHLLFFPGETQCEEAWVGVESGQRLGGLRGRRRVCGGDVGRGLQLPCQYSLLHLHSATAKGASVGLSLRPLQYRLRLMGELYCAS